jgi:hypothetical protein
LPKPCFQETHQELAGASAARDELLRLLGFTNVRFFDDLPNKVQSATRTRCVAMCCRTGSTATAG